MKNKSKITIESFASTGHVVSTMTRIQQRMLTNSTEGKDQEPNTLKPNDKIKDGNSCKGSSSYLNETDLFPVGIYRNTSDATLISFSPSVTDSNLRRNDAGICERKWVVLTATFWTMFICTGFPFNMSVLNLSFLEEFGRSNAETSLVQAVTVGIFNIAGLPEGAAISKYGVRKVGICGGLLAALGLILSFFATSIPSLVVTVGLITGPGLSACYIAASTGVGEYFSEKSKLEVFSLLSFAAGCGGIVYPYLLDFFTEEFGLRGCLLINGGLMLNMVPFFAVCKPRTIGVPKPKPMEINYAVSTITDCKAYSKEKLGIRGKFLTLMENKAYLIHTLALVILSPAITSVATFLVNFLRFQGFNRQNTVFLYSVMCIVCTLFRLLAVILKRILHLSVLMVPAVFLSVGAVTCAVLPGANTFEWHVLLLALLGMVIGGTSTVYSVAIAKLVGTENFSVGLGVALTAIGIGTVCGGPIAGYLRDTTGSYTLSLYAVSVAFGVSTCLLILAASIHKYRDNYSKKLSKYMEKRGTRRRSSHVPWKGKVEFIF